MSITKVMIIIWRWPESERNYYQIKGEENSLLCTIRYDPPPNYMDFEQKQLSWQQKVHEDMMSIFQRFANEANGVKYLILVHDVSPFSFADLYLFFSENSLENQSFKLNKFNGGKGYIYIDPIKKTGLIAKNGLARNSSYLSPDDKMFTVSVFDEQEPELIAAHYFNGVWDNYFLLNKGHFEEAYFLISKLPLDRLNKSKQSLRKYVQGCNDARLQSFFKDHNVKGSEEVRKHIQKLSGIQKLPSETEDVYVRLCKHFDQALNTPDYFTNLSIYFTQLINLLS